MCMRVCVCGINQSIIKHMHTHKFNEVSELTQHIHTVVLTCSQLHQQLIHIQSLTTFSVL